MSLNGSGTAQINTAGQPVVNATFIDPTVFNNFTADLATMISTCVMKDGQQTITADLPFNNKKLTGIAAATARTDAASIATIQDGTGVYVATVGGTADVITLTPTAAIAAYVAGQTFRFLASGANTTNVTVAISGLAAKAITKNGTTALVANDVLTGEMIGLTYDGTRFILASQVTADVVTLTGTQTLTYKTITGGLVTADPTIALGLASKQYVDALIAAFALTGGKFTVTMAANAVTIAIKTVGGADPSASSPVSIRFRSATLTDGSTVVRQITGALSTVISSGSTGGTINAIASRIYVGVLDNAGTVELCWWNPVMTTGLFSWSESGVISTTAEGGVGTANSAGVIYSTTARSLVAARYAGYFESTQATAGTWASAATVVQQMGVGVRRTGDSVQTLFSQIGASATGTTAFTSNDSVATNTQGDQYMTLAITPSSALNQLMIEAVGQFSAAAATNILGALYQDAGAAISQAAASIASNAIQDAPFRINHMIVAGTVASTTFKIRVGWNNGSVNTTLNFNGQSGSRVWGGIANSFMRITEVFQ